MKKIFLGILGLVSIAAQASLLEVNGPLLPPTQWSPLFDVKIPPSVTG